MTTERFKFYGEQEKMRKSVFELSKSKKREIINTFSEKEKNHDLEKTPAYKFNSLASKVMPISSSASTSSLL